LRGAGVDAHHVVGRLAVAWRNILRRLPHVLVAENHGDVLAVEWALENTGFFAGFAEGIGEGGHER